METLRLRNFTVEPAQRDEGCLAQVAKHMPFRRVTFTYVCALTCVCDDSCTGFTRQFVPVDTGKWVLSGEEVDDITINLEQQAVMDVWRFLQ